MLTYNESVIHLIEAGDIKNSEFEKGVVQMKACALIEVSLCGDLFETVCDSYLRVAREETSSGRLACA